VLLIVLEGINGSVYPYFYFHIYNETLYFCIRNKNLRINIGIIIFNEYGYTSLLSSPHRMEGIFYVIIRNK
jgi:hypothetical protein